MYFCSNSAIAILKIDEVKEQEKPEAKASQPRDKYESVGGMRSLSTVRRPTLYNFRCALEKSGSIVRDCIQLAASKQRSTITKLTRFRGYPLRYVGIDGRGRLGPRQLLVFARHVSGRCEPDTSSQRYIILVNERENGARSLSALVFRGLGRLGRPCWATTTCYDYSSEVTQDSSTEAVVLLCTTRE